MAARSRAAEDVEQQVQRQRTERGHGDAAVGDRAHPQRQVGEEFRTHHRDQAHADAHRHQQLVAPVTDVGFLEDLDPGGGDHAEHRNRRAAQYRRRNRGHQERGFRQQAQDDQQTAGDDGHRAAAHAGHLHQADVLREGGVGEGVEETGEERGAGITQQAATQHAWADFLAGDLAQREEHPGGLDEDDHHHQAHRQDRRELELRHAEVQRGDESAATAPGPCR